MSHLDYGIFDCDTHCYEPRDAFTRYLPEAYLDRAIAPVRNAKRPGGHPRRRPHRHLQQRAGPRLRHGLPARARSRRCSSRWPRATPRRPTSPSRCAPSTSSASRGWRCSRPRASSAACVFPAGMSLAAEHYVHDTDALYANLASFNRWYDETWGFNHQDRIYATAVLSLRDLDRAVALTDDILARGAKVVLLPTGPAYGRSPGDPYFDPVWSRLAEAGVTVAFHIMPFWYFDAISPAWGHDTDPAAWHMSAWQWMNVYGERPIIDTISSLIFDNLFGRYPNLRVLIAEHGASWVPHTLTHMDKSRGMGRNGPWIGGKLDRPARRTSSRSSCGSRPYPEDDIPWIVENLGGDDRCLVMGSDFPHAEGLADPADFEKLLDPLADDVKRRIMRGNAETIFDR